MPVHYTYSESGADIAIPWPEGMTPKEANLAWAEKQ